MKRSLKYAAWALVACLVFAMSGLCACASTADNPHEKEIMVVSFGTSYDVTRDACIGGVEQAIAAEFPEWEVTRAFTSQTVIDTIEENGGEHVNNVEEAFDEAASNGVKQLVVQPTHVVAGADIDELEEYAEQYKDKFDSIVIADSLFSSDDDYGAVADALGKLASANVEGNTAMLFVGQGSSRKATEIYEKLQAAFETAGYSNCFTCAPLVDPLPQDVAEALHAKGYSAVVLHPLTVVAGENAINDMAGQDDFDNSVAGAFAAAGFETSSMMEGLGQLEAIQQIYVAHCRAAVESLG